LVVFECKTGIWIWTWILNEAGIGIETGNGIFFFFVLP
jgi:hypothetical protein